MSTAQKISYNCLLGVLESREQRPAGNNFSRNVWGLCKQSTFFLSCAKILTVTVKNQFIKVFHGSEFTVYLKILKCILLLPFDTHAHPSQAAVPHPVSLESMIRYYWKGRDCQLDQEYKPYHSQENSRYCHMGNLKT